MQTFSVKHTCFEMLHNGGQASILDNTKNYELLPLSLLTILNAG